MEHYQSGHMYFSLKDKNAAVKTVMFRSSAARLKFRPANGMAVVVNGRISVFERDGQYQLYADSMEPAGAGVLAEAYERLKEKLAKEGLFDPLKKKSLPRYPKKIGVVTARDGAAVRDILNILSRRWSMAEVVFAPVPVQGVGASAAIAAAVAELNRLHACDLIIVGRGGGSLEDLWAFNEETLVRAVAASDIPIVSAVGHETDFTLCDFAADLRAPTPSAAAELAVPDREEEWGVLRSLAERLTRGIAGELSRREAELEHLTKKTDRRRLTGQIENHMQYCDSLQTRLRLGVERAVETAAGEFSRQVSALDALSPLKVLARGYAICEKDGKTLTGAAGLRAGDEIAVTFLDGRAACRVDGVEQRSDGRNSAGGRAAT